MEVETPLESTKLKYTQKVRPKMIKQSSKIEQEVKDLLREIKAVNSALADRTTDIVERIEKELKPKKFGVIDVCKDDLHSAKQKLASNNFDGIKEIEQSIALLNGFLSIAKDNEMINLK